MEAESLKQLVVEALDDLKAVNTVTLPVAALTDVMDYLVVASGTSNRHVKSPVSYTHLTLPTITE